FGGINPPAIGMSGVFNLFTPEHDWGFVPLATIVGLGVMLILYRAYRLRRQNAQLRSALDNMTQGLCMFDGATRLILCNERYLDMYGLTRERAYPGCALRELLEFRRSNGTFFQDIDEYVASAKRRVVEGD